jgi:hypothetical protein
MATSSIHSKFIIKDKKALDNLDKAFENQRQLPDIKPSDDDKKERSLKKAEKWMLSHSEN